MKYRWQTFVRKFDDLNEGKVELFIKDLTPGPRKYDTKHVIAEVAKSSQNPNGGEPLLVRGESGLASSETWYIKIIEDLPVWVYGHPHGNVFEAMEKGHK